MKPIIKDIDTIPAVPTAHHIGLKQVLLSCGDTTSSVTQIACTQLLQGEQVEEHVHETMDEHYLFEEGVGVMTIDGIDYDCKSGIYILVPAGCSHSLRAVQNMKFFTLGIAYDK